MESSEDLEGLSKGTFWKNSSRSGEFAWSCACRGLVDPIEHFKSGKHEGKFGAFDEKGVPTETADGTSIDDKKQKALKKEYDGVKDKWDKHQQATAKYSQDLAKYEKWLGSKELNPSPETGHFQSCRILPP